MSYQQPSETAVDLDQLVYEPKTPGASMLKRTSPDDPNEFLLGDDEIDDTDFDFDDIISEGDGDDE